ncbi:MAG: hypothetical protein KDB11_33040, partial [Planctomycetales bacterium]|nr:hypothetical protein [Planctomycetales bacterium]
MQIRPVNVAVACVLGLLTVVMRPLQACAQDSQEGPRFQATQSPLSAERADVALRRLPPVDAFNNDVPYGEWPVAPPFEELAWRKGEYRIVPYGIGWLNMAF